MYFDLAYFWRDIEHVMALTIPEMVLYLEQAQRIQKERAKAAG